METLFGIVVGVIATVVVAHYYFRRTTRKSLGVYEILSTQIFAGIEKSVRDQLKFTFRGHEVQDLQQVEFLIANDGERAISHVIEPLRHDLATKAKLLDASILYRHPESLKVDIRTVQIPNGSTSIIFDFPLLNKGDFFLVKLLLSGRAKSKDFAFRIIADDLPRSLSATWLPSNAFSERKFEIVWSAVATGFAVAGLLAWLIWILYSLYKFRPELFPYPWSTFVMSWESALLLGPGISFCVLLGLIAFALIAMVGFDEFSPWRPRFPVPKELRHRGFGYRIHISPEDIEGMLEVERGVTDSANAKPLPAPPKRDR